MRGDVRCMHENAVTGRIMQLLRVDSGGGAGV